MIKAVIFDLDDTLISERQYIESGYRHISKLLSERLGLNELELYKLLIELFRDSPKNVFNRLFDKLGVSYTNDSVMEVVEEYRNHLPCINFFDDVLPTLEMLRNKGIRVGIITDGYANAQRKKLNAVRAYDYFDEVIVTDDLGRSYWKPHPKSFEIMREKMNVEFDEMIYVGDNPKKDFYISKVYPVKTIRIHRDGVYRVSSYLKDIRENHSINSLCEVCKIFEEYM